MLRLENLPHCHLLLTQVQLLSPPFCVWASKDILPCVLVVLSIALIARPPLVTSQQLPQPTSQTALLNSEREALLICYS